MKRFVSGLLQTAMQTVYKHEEESIRQYCSQFDSGIVDYIHQSEIQFIKNHRVIDNRLQNTKGGDSIYSGACPNLNLITLTHHSARIPILVIMINSFIHLNVSHHYFKNWLLSGQFYQVFAHFSELGEMSRMYLLKCKTIGRMLDLFFNDQLGNKAQPQISEKYRNLSLEQIPLFQLDKELYMESSLKKNEAKISGAERKIAINDATSSFMFLLYSVSKLSRSCRFVKDSGPNYLANDSLNFQLDEEEIMMIINHENPLIWQNCDNKLTRNAIADMYAHVSFQNKEFSHQFLTTVLNGLQKVTFDQMKIYERPLIKMLMIKDQYQVERTKKVLQNLQEIMKQNTSYYKDMDSILDIVHKIVQRSAIAVEIINKNQGFIRFIEQWCKEYPHLPLNQQKARVFRQGVISWNSLKPNIINQSTIDKIANYQKERLQRIVSYLSKETPVNETAYDSDDDKYHHKFTVKERIDFIDANNAAWSGYVEVALNEMVKCISDVNQPNMKPLISWIGTETDLLSSPNTLVTSEKRKMHLYYMSLLRTLNN